MVHTAVEHNWTTVTTFNWEDDGDHVAYGMHWHHDRGYQNPNRVMHPRKENSDVAKRFGGWRYGRLKAMELSLVRCSKGGGRDYCLRRGNLRIDTDLVEFDKPK